MKRFASLFWHALLVIGCMSLSVIPASAEDAPDPNAIDPAVEIEIVLDKSEYELGETIKYEIFLINRLEEPIRYSSQVWSSRVYSDEAGKLDPTDLWSQQTLFGSPPLVGPRGRALISEDEIFLYDLVREGSYSIEGLASVRIYPGDVAPTILIADYSDEDKEKTRQFREVHPLPERLVSEPAPFKLRGGLPLPMHLVSDCLRKSIPEDCLLSRYPFHDKSGFWVRVWFDYDNYLNIQVGPEMQPPDQTRRSKPGALEEVIDIYKVDYLGETPWGPAWAQYHATFPKGWPEWREAVVEALDIASAEAPESTP